MTKIKIFIFLLLSVAAMHAQGAFLHQLPDSTVAKSPTYVYMLHADSTKFDKVRVPDAFILVGDVSFRRDSMYMFCDSAYFYSKKNSVRAFGNVKMEQGDTLFLYGDYLEYDGNTNLARVRNNVRLIDKETVLETDSLDFDRNINLGYYFNGGSLFDGESTLESMWGEYRVGTKEAMFNDQVSLSNPQFNLHSDTLVYNTASKVATIVGPTDIYNGAENRIYSELGRYNTASRQATLLKRSVLYNGAKNVTADSIFYDIPSGVSEIFGDIRYIDPENHNMLVGDYGYMNEFVDSAYVTRKAVVVDFSQKDSLFLHADTIWAVSGNIETDSLYRQIRAYHGVRAFSKSMQASCDSLVFDSRDSCMTMYKDPILWNEGIQLLGEQIKMYMDTASIDWVHVINQTLYAEAMDSVNYNQINGREMKFYFADGKLKEMHVIGGANVIYFPMDEDSVLVGMNTTLAGKISAYMKDGQMDRIVVPNQSKGVFYPLSKAPADAKYLENFGWFDYVRPQNKDDIFNKRGKNKDMLLKIIRHDRIPLPSLERFNKDNKAQ
ncbi:MAG: hypothetical protein IJC92_02940 [Bacteroidaceae bacterium]|nr:hypothetical protein [Bacteroidaceae bacterium]